MRRVRPRERCDGASRSDEVARVLDVRGVRRPVLVRWPLRWESRPMPWLGRTLRHAKTCRVATLTACLVGMLALPAAASASVWHLDEPSGKTAVDSGGGHNGTGQKGAGGQQPGLSRPGLPVHRGKFV